MSTSGHFAAVLKLFSFIFGLAKNLHQRLKAAASQSHELESLTLATSSLKNSRNNFFCRNDFFLLKQFFCRN
jgi:hypothetical protein